MLPALLIGIILVVDGKNRSYQSYLQKTQTTAERAIQRLQSTGYMNNRTPDINTELSLLAQYYEGRLLVVDKNLTILSDTDGVETGKTLIAEEVIHALSGQPTELYDAETQYTELILPMRVQNTEEINGVLVLKFSVAEPLRLYRELRALSLVLLSVFGACVALGALLYSLHVTKPLNRLHSAIRHISLGYLDEKLSVGGYTEIAQISEACNEMLARVNHVEHLRQEFVSNVSHELKTPMTSIKVLADSLLQQEDAPAELYKEFLTDINAEIERENQIITDLLSLVKMDKKSGEMHIAEVNINELLEMVLRRLRPIAMTRGISLYFESFRTVLAEVDEVKLSLAFTNFIENGIKYNTDGGWVRVSLNADHKYFFVKVADSGIGIPEEAQPYVFDRFYRVDKTRSRETGGTGLGLAIAKEAILMHKGAVKVYSEEGVGTTFTLRIPMTFLVSNVETAV